MAALPAANPLSNKPVLRVAGQSYLRKAMQERGTTVTALAQELGVSRKHLSNVLNGRAPLIDPLLHRLCRALVVSPAFVVCFLDDGVRPEPARYGCMKGSVVWHDDLTEPWRTGRCSRTDADRPRHLRADYVHERGADAQLAIRAIGAAQRSGRLGGRASQRWKSRRRSLQAADARRRRRRGPGLHGR